MRLFAKAALAAVALASLGTAVATAVNAQAETGAPRASISLMRARISAPGHSSNNHAGSGSPGALIGPLLMSEPGGVSR